MSLYNHLNNESFCEKSEAPEIPSETESDCSHKGFIPANCKQSISKEILLVNQSDIESIPKKKEQVQVKEQIKRKTIKEYLRKAASNFDFRMDNLFERETQKSGWRQTLEIFGISRVTKWIFQKLQNVHAIKRDVVKQQIQYENEINRLKYLDWNSIKLENGDKGIIYGKIDKPINEKTLCDYKKISDYDLANIEVGYKNKPNMITARLQFPLTKGLQVAKSATIIPSVKGVAKPNSNIVYLSPVFVAVVLNFDENGSTIFHPGQKLFVFGQKLAKSSFLATSVFNNFDLSLFRKASKALTLKSLLLTGACGLAGGLLLFKLIAFINRCIIDQEKEEKNKKNQA